LDTSTKNGLILTLTIAVIAGTFTVGKLSSDDTVKQLEKTVSSYEKAGKLNTEEFISTAISTISELKLSIIDRKSLASSKQRIIELELRIENQSTSIEGLKRSMLSDKNYIKELISKQEIAINKLSSKKNNEIAEKKSEIDGLTSRLERYESSIFVFSLNKGEGINLNGGLIHVGYTNDNYTSNVCDITVNNKKLKMGSGEFEPVENCKVTLTQCVYSSPAKPAKFELICS